VVHVLSNGLGLGCRVRELRVGVCLPPTITITVLGWEDLRWVLNVVEPEVDHGIVLVFAVTVFCLSSFFPGMRHSLSIGDSRVREVWKMALEFGDTGIGPCDTFLCIRWGEDSVIVEELVRVRVAWDGVMCADHYASIFCRSHLKGQRVTGSDVDRGGDTIVGM